MLDIHFQNVVKVIDEIVFLPRCQLDAREDLLRELEVKLVVEKQQAVLGLQSKNRNKKTQTHLLANNALKNLGDVVGGATQ